MASPDYYAVLQVHPQADREVIGAAYRRLAAKYHPDVNPSPDAADKMKQLNEAYEVLSDPARRAAYDRSRGITSGGDLRSGRSWRRFVVPIGLVVFIVAASRLGIRPALMLLVLAVVVWVVVRLWK
ncbi:DnaJ domain-containing protein [Dehalococcoidia bacterium]|nr:DnaJ domain-containing protein [Dehalococcoidia bacterium]MCL0048967.1 DnaJ domain-containing protein [Dehalococcoidia bacterium]MCL0059239.1 DnaJ domain-containing protein [Dehalococcoidia bacterium]MCL0064237.1 DnaJ domain-containing protein [Dehalococcoidia bacterium]MCL0072710.1 DnaJ domain-containing protein [Dehalococcoidia bacterium]